MTCGLPLNIPFHPWPNTLVSNTSCPQRLKTRKYLSSLIQVTNGYNSSLCPSPFGDHALGTNRSGLHIAGIFVITVTNTVSTTEQPASDEIVIVYWVVLS